MSVPLVHLDILALPHRLCPTAVEEDDDGMDDDDDDDDITSRSCTALVPKPVFEYYVASSRDEGPVQLTMLLGGGGSAGGGGGDAAVVGTLGMSRTGAVLWEVRALSRAARLPVLIWRCSPPGGRWVG